MAHFARIDENNLVVDVLVVNNADIDNLSFPESEPVGQAYLGTVFPDIPTSQWIQTSYNGTFRVRFAGLGYTFYPDSVATAYGGYCAPKWCSNLVYDDSLCEWIPPVPYPTDGNTYYWDCAEARWRLLYLQPSVPTTVIG